MFAAEERYHQRQRLCCHRHWLPLLLHLVLLLVWLLPAVSHQLCSAAGADAALC